MPRSHVIVVGVAAFIFTTFALFVFRQNVLLQAISMLGFLAGIPAFIAGVVFVTTNHGYKKAMCYVPVCAVVFAFWAGPRVGSLFRTAYFTYHLAEMQNFALTTPDSSPHDGVKWRNIYTSAGTTKSGHRYVFFWWGNGFPVKHTVFAYHSGSADEAEADFKGDWRGGPFRDNWYILSD
jgi:hypothetical protein